MKRTSPRSIHAMCCSGETGHGEWGIKVRKGVLPSCFETWSLKPRSDATGGAWGKGATQPPSSRWAYSSCTGLHSTHAHAGDAPTSHRFWVVAGWHTQRATKGTWGVIKRHNKLSFLAWMCQEHFGAAPSFLPGEPFALCLVRGESTFTLTSRLKFGDFLRICATNCCRQNARS